MDVYFRSTEILCSYHRHTAVPLVVDREIRDDFYTLFTPLSRANIRVARSGKLLFEGELQPGMLRLAAPGEPIQITLKSQLSHLELVIPGASLRNALRRAGYVWRTKLGFLEPLNHPNRTVARIASALVVAKEVRERQRPSYIAGLTDSLLACLVAGQRLVKSPKSQAEGRSLTDSEFQQCCEYADSMMGKKLALQRWASTLDMETAEFSRRFRKRTDLSPYAWFLGRKIEHAKQLLHEQKLSIIDVALKVGFGSQSHFTEAFRRHVGCSPARWRDSAHFQHAD